MDIVREQPLLALLSGLVLFLLVCVLVVIQISGKRFRQLKQLAYGDPVTGGLNRAGFCDAAGKYIPQQNQRYSLVRMEIRNYSQILEAFGPQDRDRVLIHLHKVLKTVLSSAEPAAVLGGGSFCFLLKNHLANDIQARLIRIRERANQYNSQRRIPYMLDLQFGIYVPQSNTETAEEMLEKTLSLVQDGEDGAFCHFYRPSATDSPARRWELVKQLDPSMQNGDFIVYLQPRVRLSDSRIVGAEALIRWRHPQLGMLTPEMFLSSLEEYHLVPLLDRHLFEIVCRKLSSWERSGRKPCPVSVNVACETLEAEGCLDSFSAMARQYGVAPERIEFELNESLLLRNTDRIHSLIDRIHACGFLCSLDNFGKTSIPLHLLRELDVDTIKLDRGLLSFENNSRRSRFTIEAILKLAAQMQIPCVAAGIDNASQVQYLQQAGCDMIQGYFFFRPMPAEEFLHTAYQNGELRYVSFSTADAGQGSGTAPARSGSSNIVMFSFQPEEDRILFSEVFSPALEGKSSISSASALFRHSGLIHENDRKDFFHLLERCAKEDKWVETAIRFYTAEGRYEWLEVYLHREQLDNHLVISGTLVNTAGWKKEVKRWKEKANRDALTGIYNREYFEQYTANCLEKGSISTGAVVFVDVDDFKQVNDTLGHVVGDDVLCFIAKRLLGAFRHTDIVARYGGDEFVIFVNGIARADLEKRLTQLCGMFRFPYRNGSIEYNISGSIGAAMYPEDGRSYRELLDHADAALYTAKNRGKNQFVFYQPSQENPG